MKVFAASVAAALFGFAAPVVQAQSDLNIVEVAIAAGFETLVAAVQFTELVDALAAPEPLKTVFAPTDAAFAALPDGLLDTLLTEEGKPILTDILLYHVVGSQNFAADLIDGQVIGTLQGEDVVVSIGDDIKINDSVVISTDVQTTNGVIHVIDSVLIPPSFLEDDGSDSEPLESNIVETAIAAGFDTLVAAVVAADLVDALAAEEPLKTVFAPTNEAFAALGDAALGFLLTPQGIPTLTNVLLYHVVGAQSLSTDLTNGQEIETLLGETVVVSIDGDVLKINDSTVVAADVLTSNGVIHVIDAVLIPPGFALPPDIVGLAVSAGFFNLVSALQAAGLVDTVKETSPLTVFAPTDAAFDALFDALPPGSAEFILTTPEVIGDILLYHVVSGAVFSTDLETGSIDALVGGPIAVNVTEEAIFINQATVVAPDNVAINGIVHAIDAVLIPPGFEVPLDIPATAIAAGGFDTLVTALAATKLVGAVSFPNGPFTVFAPTDEAFGAFPFGVIANLLSADGLPTLKDILLYHVVEGAVFSTDLSDGQIVHTLGGRTVEVSARGKKLFINESEVIAADIEATNGVIHVIDAVLLFPGVEVVVPDKNIVEIAVGAGFDTLVAAVTFAELVDPLLALDPKKTVFAPTNEAFAALPSDLLAFLLTETGKPTLTDILLYHVVGSPISAVTIADGDVIETLLGEELVASVDGDMIKINDSKVIGADIVGTNGIIHVIDAVLLQPSLFTGDIPGTAVAAGGFDTLVAALTATDLVGAVAFPNGPLTVFAPTDDAFAALPFGLVTNLLKPEGLPLLTDILLYHVVSGVALSTDLQDGQKIKTLLGDKVEVSVIGTDLFINDSKVVAADIVVSNGVIHAIDAVLVFKNAKLPVPKLDIVETAVAAGFDTLAAAVGAAGLVEALKAPEPLLTVFAPTDEAFAALPADLVSFYLTSGIEVLTNILLYHVVPSPIFAADLTDGATVTTLLGEDVTAFVDGEMIKINDSNVIATDVLATNGVIHVIDAVLLQPSLFTTDIPSIAVGGGVFNTLVAALTAADLVSALVFPSGPFTVFAPTDDAFAGLPFGVLQSLLLEENLEILVNVLLYHVVPLPALSTDLTDGQSIPTLFGETLHANFLGGDLFINESKVISADIIASNGIVHVIDEVLLFEGFEFPVNGNDIAETAIAGGFDTLVAALSATDLVGAVSAPNGAFTVFAPTDDAFAALPFGLLGNLLKEENLPTLAAILLYHVVDGIFSSTDLAHALSIETLQGEDVHTSITEEGLFINDSKVVAADIWTTNGLIHAIDAVLLFEDIELPLAEADIVGTAVAGGFDLLVAAVSFAELVDALVDPTPKTVFAPTDEAFLALPEPLFNFLLTDGGKATLTDILLYHVVGEPIFASDLSDGDAITTLEGSDVTVSIDGDSIKINDSNVIAADILTTNGVIHAIDAVLLQQSLFDDDIPGTAVSAGGFNTLISALTATGLIRAVSFTNGPLTVFAPTDAAFEALSEGLILKLLEDKNLPVLTDILLYHVVAGIALSTDLSDGQQVETLLGDTVEVSITKEGDLFINDSKVVAADIVTTNGVIHAIDAVLLFPDVPQPVPSGDIVETAIAAGFDTLVAAVSFAGLVDALVDPAPKTVFAPTNEAFAALPSDILGFLLTETGKGTLTDILLYHVVDGAVLAGDLTDGQSVTTLLGEDVTVSVGPGIKINDSNVVLADVITFNGIIHVIDAVLLQDGLFSGDIPGTAVAAGGFDTLVAALTATDLVGAVSFPNGPFTVFAPTDDAFAALPFGLLQNLLKTEGLSHLTDILLYHVVSGVALSTDLKNKQKIVTLLGDTVEVLIDKKEGLFINDSKVVAADIITSNGVVHAIDAVLVFDDAILPVPTADIVETAVAAGFDTLAAAVTFAGLVKPLQAAEPLKTVFAPTNDAFAALGADLLEFLLTNEGKGTLTDVLLYHVVDTPIFASDLTDGATVKTLLESDVTVTVNEIGIFINDSEVIIADVVTSNGVVHAIDAVLIPPGFTPPAL